MVNSRPSYAFLGAVVVLIASLVIAGPRASSDAAAAAVTSETIFGSVVPAHQSDPDSAKVELGVRFKAAANGTVTAVRFYKSTGNTGTHTGRLYGPTGALLKSVAFTAESATGWQQATFSAPVAVTAGVEYTVSYMAPNGHYAGDNNYRFPKVVGDLTALAGVYKYGGGFPTPVWQSSNYYVDVQFTPSRSDTIFGSVVPAHQSDPDSAKVELGVRFKAAANGTVTAVRFYKSTGNTGTHTGRLYGPTGALLKSVTFTAESATGWQQATFSAPVAVTAGVEYTVSYMAPNGHYADDTGYQWPKVSGDLTALSGVYKYGGGFPTSVWQSSNYYTDVVFAPEVTSTSGSTTASSTLSGPATTAPTLTPNTAPASGTTTTTSPSPSGWFSSNAAGQIIDPDGKEFIPVGVNANGPDWVWGDPTIGQSAVMDVSHFNTLRVNTCFVGGCPATDGTPATYDSHTNDNLDGIVSEYTAKHDVIMIGQMNWGAGGQWAQHIPELAAWWAQTAARYKDNPYVWFNLENEPTTDAVSDNPQVLNQWADLHSQMSTAIRAVAPNNVIVMDGNESGQERGTWSCNPDMPANGAYSGGPYLNSAFVNKGPQMEAAYGPVVFSLHVYGMWGGNESGGCTPALWDQTFTTFVDKVHSLGLPMLIGETGSVSDKAGEQWNEGGSWNAVQMLTRVLPSAPIKTGVLFWHGSGNSPFSLFDQWGSWTEYPPTEPGKTLNWKGQFMYNYARQVNP